MKNYPGVFAVSDKQLIKKVDGSFALFSSEEVQQLSRQGKIQIEYPKSKGGRIADLTQKPIKVLIEWKFKWVCRGGWMEDYNIRYHTIVVSSIKSNAISLNGYEQENPSTGESTCERWCFSIGMFIQIYEQSYKWSYINNLSFVFYYHKPIQAMMQVVAPRQKMLKILDERSAATSETSTKFIVKLRWLKKVQ